MKLIVNVIEETNQEARNVASVVFVLTFRQLISI